MIQCGNIKIHVEVPLLLLFFAFQLGGALYTNFIIYRTCYVILGYNKSECALLGSPHKDSMSKHLEKIVEPHASIINMTQTFIEAFMGGLICLFVGPWSDKFGRKPLLLLPILGYSLAFGYNVLLSLFPNISPWYFVGSIVPISVCGGFGTFLTGVLAYITDVTSEENRGMRIGIFEVTLALGTFLGNVCSPYLFYATNYTTVFATCSFCAVLASIFTIFCIPESLTTRETQGHFRGFFQLSHLKDMYRTTFKKREHHTRTVILCSAVIMTVYILIVLGSGSVMFLYVREKFQWSLEDFTIYSSVSNVIYISGTGIGIYVLHKLLHVKESILVLTGFLSLVNCALIQGLATKGWHLYFASSVHSLSGTISPMTRSLVSKCVPNAEVGKIFALIVVGESLIGLLGGPLYTLIYNSTITTDPGVFNFISAGLYLLCTILTLVIVAIEWLRPMANNIAPYESSINAGYDSGEESLVE